MTRLYTVSSFLLLLCHSASLNDAFVFHTQYRPRLTPTRIGFHRQHMCPLLHRQTPLCMTSNEQQQGDNSDTDNPLSESSSPLPPSSSSSSTNGSGIPGSNPGRRSDQDVGGYDPSERIGDGINVGDPQIKVKEKERSVTSILKELAAIQQQGPQKYCILGTRHCSFLHQQIIELLYVFRRCLVSVVDRPLP